jgi:hypothetical protein
VRGGSGRRLSNELDRDVTVTRIQAGFRGMKARREVRNLQADQNSKAEFSESAHAWVIVATQIQAGFHEMKERKNFRNATTAEDETDVDAAREAAVVKIEAGL